MLPPNFNLYFVKPSPHVQEFINSIMVFRCNLPQDAEQIKFSLPPMPEHSICFYGASPVYITVNTLKNNFTCYMPSSLQGPNEDLFTITLARQTLLVKVLLQPGVLSRLLNAPLTALQGIRNFESIELFGRDLQQANERIANATEDITAIQIAEQYIYKKMQYAKEKLPIDWALNELLRHGGLLPIDKLAAYSCLCLRQFERQCLWRTGYSPKFFSRQARFARAWLMKEHNPQLNWTCIAHQCGYFDQMHFIRDFKDFANITPSMAGKSIANLPFNPRNKIIYEGA
jgi:AraC-like DNA-binding protein